MHPDITLLHSALCSYAHALGEAEVSFSTLASASAVRALTYEQFVYIDSSFFIHGTQTAETTESLSTEKLLQAFEPSRPYRYASLLLQLDPALLISITCARGPPEAVLETLYRGNQHDGCWARGMTSAYDESHRRILQRFELDALPGYLYMPFWRGRQ